MGRKQQPILLGVSTALLGAALFSCVPSPTPLKAQTGLVTLQDSRSAISTIDTSDITLAVPRIIYPNYPEATVKEAPPSKGFLEKLRQIKDPSDRDQHRYALLHLKNVVRRDPVNNKVLTQLVDQQEVALDALLSCTRQTDGSARLSWDSVNRSKVWKLSDQQSLIQLVCLVGAYNLGFTLLLASETPEGIQFKVLNLSYFRKSKSGEIQREEVTRMGGSICPNGNASTGLKNEYFDPSTGELCIWSRYVGEGRCGTRAKYQLQDDEFVLQEFKAKFDCDIPPGSSRTYETIYP